MRLIRHVSLCILHSAFCIALALVAAVLSAAQSSLPDGAKLRLADSGKSLEMTISPGSGLILFVR